MSNFDFTTLITDRTQADVSAVSDLIAKIRAGTATTEEKEQFNAAAMRGAYNYTDLNRVSSAVYYLDEILRGYGYQTGVQKIVVPHEESGGGGTSRLPEGYTELEYIESSGTQYIDTGFNPKATTRIIEEAEIVSYTSNGSYFGARAASSGTDSVSNTLLILAAGTIRSDFYGSSITGQSFPNGKHIVDRDGNITVVDGATITNTESSKISTFHLFLFGTNTNGTMTLPGILKCYSCQIYDNGTEIRDYIPCKNSAGTVGLYDLIGGLFYANAGTGIFIAGPEITTPSQPSEPSVEYDDYTWYEPDVPTQTLMATYLANVVAVYTALLSDPELPETMQNLTVYGANWIEQALIDVQQTIERIVAAFSRSNAFTFWSGNRPLPSAKSDLGRNWGELDAMETTWANWQVATWYLLLYGNLQAEGVVE